MIVSILLFFYCIFYLRSTDRKGFDVFTVNEELDVCSPDHQAKLVPCGVQTWDGELYQGLLPHLVKAGQKQRHLLERDIAIRYQITHMHMGDVRPQPAFRGRGRR